MWRDCFMSSPRKHEETLWHIKFKLKYREEAKINLRELKSELTPGWNEFGIEFISRVWLVFVQTWAKRGSFDGSSGILKCVFNSSRRKKKKICCQKTTNSLSAYRCSKLARDSRELLLTLLIKTHKFKYTEAVPSSHLSVLPPSVCFIFHLPSTIPCLLVASTGLINIFHRPVTMAIRSLHMILNWIFSVLLCALPLFGQ